MSKKRNTWKQRGKKSTAYLLVAAVLASVVLSVAATPPKAKEVKAWYVMDFAASALENCLMEGMGWAADTTENQGVKDIYDMLAVATGGSGTDVITQYCNDIQNTLGAIRQDIGMADMHIADQINDFSNRDANLGINQKYNAMQTVTGQCDSIINAYSDYIALADEYAQAQNSGSPENVIEEKKAAAEIGRTALVTEFVRGGDDLLSPDEIGKIGTEKYEAMLESLADKACTGSISYRPNELGANFQNKNATFTGLLYEKYSLNNNIFDHQHRDAIETGMNASASQFVKVIMAYRIQLDYVKAENDDLAEKGIINHAEAAKRMKDYEEKYQDFVYAAANALQDIGTMYQKELSGLMYTYDKHKTDTIFPIHDGETKLTEWYWVDNRQAILEDKVEREELEPGRYRELDLSSRQNSFFRVSVRGVSYLISKKQAGLVPEDFVYNATGRKDGGEYDYKLRSEYFYRLGSTGDNAYHMIQNQEELKDLYEGVYAWGTSTGGFASYLAHNGQLNEPESADSQDSPFDEGASYIVVSQLHKEESEYSKHVVDGKGEVSYSASYYPSYSFNQKMNMIRLDFNNQKQPELSHYESSKSDDSSGVLLIMKETDGVKEEFGLNTRAINAADGLQVDNQQVQFLNGNRASPGDQLQIKITPNAGWTLDTLKILVDGQERKILSGRHTFEYVKDENGSFIYYYDMPYGNVTAEAAFVVEEGSNLDGDGTEENPYIIENADDYLTAVQMISRYVLEAKAHYKVVNDIDFGSLMGTERTEIDAYFGGVWDGGGHTFTNLGPNKYVGTKPWMLRIAKDGVVKNQNFTDCRFANLVTANYGTIDHCASLGSGIADYEGMVYENTGKILNCYNTAPIIRGSSKGSAAIVQKNNKNGIVANCWNRGGFWDVKDRSENGGLVLCNEGLLYNCYNTGMPKQTDVQPFGALIYKETTTEPGSTLENCFFPDSLGQWAKLPSQDYVVGTMLTDAEMRGDGGLVRKLNEGLVKGRELGLDLKYWTRNDGVNDGYPTFHESGNTHNITVEAEHGQAELTFQDGTKVEGTAAAGMKIGIIATSETGWTLKNITLHRPTGEPLAELYKADQGQDNVQVVFDMPDEDCVVKVQYYQFEKDKEKDTYLIGSYQGLLDIAEAVNNSDHFAEADFRLTADIQGQGQAWPALIGEDRAYKGTFDGGGFSISRLVLDRGHGRGGIFGTIGTTGVVKNLGVFGFTVNSPETAGGLAAVNEGTIDNCWTGTSQLGDGNYTDADGEHSLSDLNSTITSDKEAGGIAGINKGTIVNSRSGANVTGGSFAGGIAGCTESSGKHGIFNSYAVGNIGGSNTAGGIVGEMRGSTIQNVYFAGSTQNAPVQGGVAADVWSGTIKDSYYPAAEGRNTVQEGTMPMNQEDMRKKSFADRLNAGVTKQGYDYWTQNDHQRNGYPYLTHNAYVDQVHTDPVTGIAVSGTIHAGAILKVNQLKAEDTDYTILDKYVNGQKLKGVFHISLDIQGIDKEEPPFQDAITLSFPADAGTAAGSQWILHYNGEEVHVHKDVQLIDGKLEVQVKELQTFGIIDKQDADESKWDNNGETGDENNNGETGDENNNGETGDENNNGETGDENNNVETGDGNKNVETGDGNKNVKTRDESKWNKNVKTGDENNAVILFVLVGISAPVIAAAMYVRRHKKDRALQTEKEGNQ